MTNEEAIKFLQQLYPLGGHCWLDEQRMEAIGMAIEALSQSAMAKTSDKEKIRAEIERRYNSNIEAAETFAEGSVSRKTLASAAKEDYGLLAFIDSLIGESLIVYVVTRCEEHSDYVEEVFLDEDKATAYCKRFEGNEDEYARHITKTKVTETDNC